MRGNIILRVPIVDVARKTKNAAQPATEKKFLRLIRQMPGSPSGGRSCFGFLIAATFGVALIAVPSAGAAGTGGTAGAPAAGFVGSFDSTVLPLGVSITLDYCHCLKPEKYRKKKSACQILIGGTAGVFMTGCSR